MSRVTVSPDLLLDRLARRRTLAIVRGHDPDAAAACVGVLAEEGMDVVEVSLSSTDALRVLREARAGLDDDVLLGAGTVRTVAELDAAVAAGAQFAVSPAFNEVAFEAQRRGLPVLPSVLSSTELDHALHAGFPVLKLFPASFGGPRYVRALLDPYPHARLVPVGGVELDLAPAYLEAGSLAVGVGSPLVGDAADGGSLSELRSRVRRLMTALEAGARA